MNTPIPVDPAVLAILADMDIRRRPPAGSLAELERDFPEDTAEERSAFQGWVEITDGTDRARRNEKGDE